MSTELYLECVTHTPSIQSGHIGFKKYSASLLEEVLSDLRNRERLVDLLDEMEKFNIDHSESTFRRTRLDFLSNHRDCVIIIADENGDKYDHLGQRIEPTHTVDAPLSHALTPDALGRVTSVSYDANGDISIGIELTPRGVKFFEVE